MNALLSYDRASMACVPMVFYLSCAGHLPSAFVLNNKHEQRTKETRKNMNERKR